MRAGTQNTSLKGRTVYIPRMSYEAARMTAAAFEAIGVEAEILPEFDSRTFELGKQYTSGDECFPQQVTLGGCLKVLERNSSISHKIAFLMPTAGGPCRFGQYAPFLRKVFQDLGCPEVLVFSPASESGYNELGESGPGFIRLAWRSIVAADILRKLLLKTRPYEQVSGTTEEVFCECLDRLCQVIAERKTNSKKHLARLLEALIQTRSRFRAIPQAGDRSKPLIGIVGEIYCRLDQDANEEIIKTIEAQGGEAWLSDISEWVWYVNFEETEIIRREHGLFSRRMLLSTIKHRCQRSDEHAMMNIFKEDFTGYEEPAHIQEILRRSLPYLPYHGAIGEMTLNVGRSIYLYEKGVDGILDVSPFTCMNAIVSEAVYPRVSTHHDNIPIKVFYFDGSQYDWGRDVGIFLELARSYQRRKHRTRHHLAVPPIQS